MSYSIQYGPMKPPKAKNTPQPSILILAAAVLIPTIALAARSHPEESKEARTSLFPWEQEYVQEAFADFSDSVRSGGNFKDAVEALYMQILDAEDTAQ